MPSPINTAVSIQDRLKNEARVRGENHQDAQKVSQWTAFLRKNHLAAPGLSQVIETIRTRFPFPL